MPAVAPMLIEHGDRNAPRIALTFDACSTREPGRLDEQVTSILVATHTPATIFLGGKWMTEEQNHTRYLASFPQFELANHTYLHPHMTRVSDDRIRQELIATEQVLYTLTGRRSRFFRPPYVEADDRVIRIAAELGLTTVTDDLASGDPDPHATRERLDAWVESTAKNGSIIVMHINGRGWHTAEALPDLITALSAKGFTFVTLSELLGLPPQKRAPATLSQLEPPPSGGAASTRSLR